MSRLELPSGGSHLRGPDQLEQSSPSLVTAHSCTSTLIGWLAERAHHLRLTRLHPLREPFNEGGHGRDGSPVAVACASALQLVYSLYYLRYRTGYVQEVLHLLLLGEHGIHRND